MGLALMLAVVSCVGWAAFLSACTWLCTRGGAAAALVLIALISDMVPVRATPAQQALWREKRLLQVRGVVESV